MGSTVTLNASKHKRLQGFVFRFHGVHLVDTPQTRFHLYFNLKSQRYVAMSVWRKVWEQYCTSSITMLQEVHEQLAHLIIALYASEVRSYRTYNCYDDIGSLMPGKYAC